MESLATHYYDRLTSNKANNTTQPIEPVEKPFFRGTYAHLQEDNFKKDIAQFLFWAQAAPLHGSKLALSGLLRATEN